MDKTQGPISYVILDSNPNPQLQTPNLQGDPNSALTLKVLSSKKGEADFRTRILPLALDFIEKCLYDNRPVCIACATGNDLSVGVAVAVLQMFFDDEGVLRAPGNLKSTPGKPSFTVKRNPWF